MNYNTDVGFANLAWSFVGNWTRHSKFNANVASPDSLNRECVGYYSVNCSFTGSIQPEFQFSNRFTLGRSEEHTSELQSLLRISYAVFCLKKTKKHHNNKHTNYYTIPPNKSNERHYRD